MRLKQLAVVANAVLFFFVFQQLQLGWAWEVQPSGDGIIKIGWGGERLAKRPVPTTAQANLSKLGSRYLRIGGDPKNPNRQLEPGEKVQISTQDLWVETNSGSGKIYKGWLPAGTEFVTIPAVSSDPTLRKAVWIKKCGNDILNSEKNAIFFRVQPSYPTSLTIHQPTAPPQPESLPKKEILKEEMPEVKKESWFSKNWPWILGGLVVIAGVVIAAGTGSSGGGSGGGSQALEPSPPPLGNQ